MESWCCLHSSLRIILHYHFTMLARTLLSVARPSQKVFARNASVVYTHTDEAPALATYALLPVLKRFGATVGVDFETSDISVAARILAQFPESLSAEQQQEDCLGQLGELSVKPDANIIKLPNVSASIPQLQEAIAELQAHGYNIPDYPMEPSNDAERAIAATYAKVLGSAVNPVLREGNSDRRAAAPVKAHAQASRSALKPWANDCKTHVAAMSEGDFFGSEQSAVMASGDDLKIEHVSADGSVSVLKDSVPVLDGEVVDAARMSAKSLRAYFMKEIADAKANDVMLSLHLKATMMKISDPILFGHAVTCFFDQVFEKHGAVLESVGANPNLGWGAVLDKIATLPADAKAAVEADIADCYAKGPRLAMVDSSKGITNLHVPSDVIIDASMPNVIRDSGKMWNKDDALEDTKALIPDRSYAGVYQTIVEYCAANGQFDASTMGHVSNVGLMAKKAEEYGSHDKTFEIAGDGVVRVVNSAGATVFEHDVEAGDIWRMCQTKDVAIEDWVKLAVSRARNSGSPAIFWLNAERAHDASLIAKIDKYLPNHDTTGLDISIKTPVDAIQTSMERATAGHDTISVTGAYALERERACTRIVTYFRFSHPPPQQLSLSPHFLRRQRPSRLPH